MTGARRSIAAFVTVALFGATALSAPSTSDVAEATKSLSEGQKLLTARRWAEARTAFEASLARDARGVTLKGLGDALRGEGRLPEAYDAYQRALSPSGQRLLPGQRKDVERAIADLEHVTALLTLEVDPPGAALAVDGTNYGTSPASKAIRILSGSHRVVVTAPGYSRFEATINLEGGGTKTVSAKLVASALPINTGDVTIRESSGRAVDVRVDGIVVGQTPLRASFAKGSYRVALVNGDAKSEDNDLVVAGGDRVEMVMPAPQLAADATDGDEVECTSDDECGPKERCRKRRCEGKGRKRSATEGESCADLLCERALVCSEQVCRSKEKLPFPLRSGLSAQWRLGVGLSGESQWNAPVHQLGGNLEIAVTRWVRYHLTAGLASVQSETGVHIAPLGFGVPIPVIEEAPDSGRFAIYVEPGLDPIRVYGLSGGATDVVASVALWGRVTASRGSIFFTAVPLELERPVYRITGSTKSSLFFGTSGLNYVPSIGVGVFL